MRSALLAFLLLAATTAFCQPKGLNTGATAPNFEAKDQNGKTVSLQQLQQKGPVVLFFYRGQWCPYCSKQISQMEDSLSLLTGKGASVIAVSPEIQENVAKTVAKTKASFRVLHDEGLRIMKAYDVAYEVDPATVDKYKKYKIDFDQVNGANGKQLPVPAVYIIKDGKVIYRYFNEDYTKRPSVKELAAQL